ncbi:MAG: hypothetical protein GFH27_549323n5 [Chloroflexi bacterium AL-W]|nr:hypothetical protein [Chloroflexi bacterium AL-N1]NOK70156.1 hypothetical protein [Chloroflexi bacterium AL-N10]NOK77693.1 hypothetical protein [Chloroflexi bacterium AL-N5]NOK84702.1 hypothetical protein [Chloroflexi bacterium AL-W]NOK93235.1 hypothetical protein [Chloroflexi bacterium AL-N15]
MRITIESTEKLITLRTDTGTVPARIWEGVSESGIPVIALVTRVAVAESADTTAFEAELQQHRAPSAEVEVWPLKLVL